MVKMKCVHLPEEVITEILLRLSVKTLIRFKCVCKSLRSLISHDSHFAISHFQLTASHTHKLFFIYYDDDDPKTLSIDASLDYDSSFSSLNLRFLRPHFRLHIGGSCRGFLLLHCHKCLYLWNPSTGIHKKIPNSPLTIASNNRNSKLLSGLAYEPLTDDYFVVLGSFDAFPREYDPIDLEIFSLRANKWKQIEDDSHLPYTNTANTNDSGPIVGLVLNGSIYWLVYNFETRRNHVIALDLKEMRLSEIAIPVDFYRDSSFIDYDLFLFGGLISVWIIENYTVEIWVMQDYGGAHISWTKTVTFSYHPAPNFNPIYFTNCGDIVGTVGDGGLVKFDDKGLLLNYRSNDDCFFDRSRTVVYTKSLLSFPDGSDQA